MKGLQYDTCFCLTDKGIQRKCFKRKKRGSREVSNTMPTRNFIEIIINTLKDVTVLRWILRESLQRTLNVIGEREQIKQLIVKISQRHYAFNKFREWAVPSLVPLHRWGMYLENVFKKILLGLHETAFHEINRPQSGRRPSHIDYQLKQQSQTL